MFYVLKDRTFDRYYSVDMDSYGYTVKRVVDTVAEATKFDTRKVAKDILEELDDYWREQAKVTGVDYES